MTTQRENQLTYLVLTATGKTGRRVADRLEGQGLTVRRASRSSATPFDWDQPSTWGPALEGVHAAYIVYSPDLAVPAAPAAIQQFTELAVQHGVKKLVLLSGRGEEEAQRCEQIVMDSGADWTVVRASWFNQNFDEGEFVEMVRGGTVALPARDIPEPFIDVNDIADVAVAALTEPGHEGEVYEVTGPRLMTFTEAVAEIAEVTGRELAFVQLTGEQFEAGLRAHQTPDEMVWLLNYLFNEVLDGRNAQVCDGVERALGRKPRDFADYVREAAATGVWEVQVPA